MTLRRLSTALVVFALSASAQTLKIGVQIPLTGERADVGQIMKNTLEMAAAAINAKPGTHVDLDYADDLSTNDGSVAALNKLIADQVTAIVGEINSPLVMASRPLVEERGIPYITGGTSPRTTDGAQWIYRAGASDAVLAGFIARYAAETLKAKSIAIVHDKTGVHNQRATLVTNALKDKYQLTPVADASWSPGDTDFKSVIDQARAKNPDLIIALGETPEGGAFFKQLKASGNKATVIAHRDFGVKKAIDDSAGGADGVLIFTEYAPDLQDQATKAWTAAYMKKYSSAANVIAAQYYDALMLIAEAAKSGATRAGIKTGLEKEKAWKGVLAEYTFDAGHNGVHRIFVAKVAGGKLTPVTTLTE